jgi:hypothetical protein
VSYYPRTGKYLGESDHSVWTKKQAGPYKSMALKDSPEEAVQDAVTGMLTFYSDDEPERLVSDEELVRTGRQRPKPLPSDD